MSSIFSSLARFFQQKYTKPLIGFGLIIFMGVCFWESGTGPQYETADLTKNIIEIFDLLFGLLALILWPMVILAGWLLSPDWTMGDFFGLRAYFKEVWILVANIVYIIFALMLLYMAIMQIFGWSESDYAFKKKLPSFLVWILLVPFTWLIVSWKLSFANQAVAAVLSIPMGAIGKLDTGGKIWEQNTSQWHRKVLPTQFDFSDGASGYGPGVKCEAGTLSNNADVRCISPAEFLAENQAGPFFIIMIYAYNIFKIQEADISELTKLCTGEASKSSGTQYKSAKTCVEDLMGIVRNFGLSLIITVFFAIMLIALCWILLMRAIKLWIYVMLSPLFGLAYFTGKWFWESVWEKGESWFGQVWFKSFFKLAMVPVLVSAVLAFGLLFVWVVRDNFNGAKDPNQKEFCTEQNVGYMVTYCITEQTEGSKKVYTSKLIIWTDTNLSNGDAKITLNFWDSFSKIISTSEASSVAAGAVSGGISSVEDIFAHIILTMLALVFMFMGVKVAANFDPVTEAAFKPFASLGASVWKMVAHSPSYLPLPHPAFAAVTNPWALANMVDMKVRSSINQSNASIWSSLSDMMGWQRQDFEKSFNDFKTGAWTFDNAVSNFLLTSEKNPQQAKEMVLEAIKQLPASQQADPKVIAFKKTIDSTRNAEGFSHAFENHPEAVDMIETSQRWGGMKKLWDSMWAAASSASQPFWYANKIENDGSIRNWVNQVVSFANGNFTAQLNSPAERGHVKTKLPLNIIITENDSQNNALLQSIFPWISSTDINKRTKAEKKAILEALKKAAN